MFHSISRLYSETKMYKGYSKVKWDTNLWLYIFHRYTWSYLVQRSPRGLYSCNEWENRPRNIAQPKTPLCKVSKMCVACVILCNHCTFMLRRCIHFDWCLQLFTSWFVRICTGCTPPPPDIDSCSPWFCLISHFHGRWRVRTRWWLLRRFPPWFWPRWRCRHGKTGERERERGAADHWRYWYGSIPIDTIFSGLFTSINPSYDLGWTKGTRVLTHPHIVICHYILRSWKVLDHVICLHSRLSVGTLSQQPCWYMKLNCMISFEPLKWATAKKKKNTQVVEPSYTSHASWSRKSIGLARLNVILGMLSLFWVCSVGLIFISFSTRRRRRTTWAKKWSMPSLLSPHISTMRNASPPKMLAPLQGWTCRLVHQFFIIFHKKKLKWSNYMDIHKPVSIANC